MRELMPGIDQSIIDFDGSYVRWLSFSLTDLGSVDRIFDFRFASHPAHE